MIVDVVYLDKLRNHSQLVKVGHCIFNNFIVALVEKIKILHDYLSLCRPMQHVTLRNIGIIGSTGSGFRSNLLSTPLKRRSATLSTKKGWFQPIILHILRRVHDSVFDLFRASVRWDTPLCQYSLHGFGQFLWDFIPCLLQFSNLGRAQSADHRKHWVEVLNMQAMLCDLNKLDNHRSLVLRTKYQRWPSHPHRTLTPSWLVISAATQLLCSFYETMTFALSSEISTNLLVESCN